MPERFSDKKYILPFGRYVGSTEVEPPADAVLVGREGQRAYLIDLLISTGRRGAYLVTGRRGAGKTSFVKNCIGEYEASVFSRFLRGNVGRGVWDRFFVLLFWLAILVGALLGSEVIQFLVSPGKIQKFGLLRWAIVVPIGVALLYPCAFAKAIFETCLIALRDLRSGSEKNRDKRHHRWAGVWAVISVIFAAVLAWFLPYLGNPRRGIPILLALVSFLYALGQSISFQREKKVAAKAGLSTDEYASIESGRSKTEKLKTFFLTALRKLLPYVGLIAVGLLVFYFCMNQTSRCNLTLSMIFLGLGALLRSIDQVGRQWLVKYHPARNDATEQTFRLADTLKGALQKGAQWYLAFGSVTFLVGLIILRRLLGDKPGLAFPVFLILSAGLAIFPLFLLVTRWNRAKLLYLLALARLSRRSLNGQATP